MMGVAVGLFAVAVAFTAVGVGGGAKAPRWPARVPSARRAGGAKLVAGLRLIGSTALAFALASYLVELTGELAPPLRWPLWLLAGSGLFAVLVNGLAGLWLLSPSSGVDPGREIQVSHLRGTIRSYGWFRLAISTPAGWLAQVPYSFLLYRTVIVRREDRARAVVLTLRRKRWSSDQTRYLHQAAILCPYRDPSQPVMISLRSRTLEIRLGLALGASEERVRRLLEQALDRHSELEPARTDEVPENAH